MTRLSAILGVFVISFSAIFYRFAAVSADTAAFFRFAYALPLLYAFYRFQGPDPRLPRERWGAFAAGAFLAVDIAVWHRAIEVIGVGLSTVLGNTQVVLVGVAAWALYGERPSRRAMATLPLVLIGATLISGLGSPEAYGSNPALGVLLGLSTALLYCLFLLQLRASNRRQAPPAGPMLDATAGAAVTALVLGLGFGHFDLTPHWPAHGWLLALAFLSQTIGWQLISFTLPRLAALETSVILLLQPMLTVLWGWLLFAERLAPIQWAGVALVLGGVAMVSAKGATNPAPEQALSDSG